MIQNRKLMLQIIYVSNSWIMLRQNTWQYTWQYWWYETPQDTNVMMYGCTDSSISRQKVEALRCVKAADTAWLEYGNMEAGIITIYNAYCTGSSAI